MNLFRCESTWCSKSTPRTTTASSWTSSSRGWSVTQVGRSLMHLVDWILSTSVGIASELQCSTTLYILLILKAILVIIMTNINFIIIINNIIMALIIFIMITNTQSEPQTWVRPCSWWGSSGPSSTRRTCLPGEFLCRCWCCWSLCCSSGDRWEPI